MRPLMPICALLAIAASLHATAILAAEEGATPVQAIITATLDEKAEITVRNPDPTTLPTLGLWWEREQLYVSAAFPNVPGFICDSWCYESDVDFVDARALADGTLQLRHRPRQTPQVLIVTTVTPEPGAIEFLAHAELDPAADTAMLPASLLTPNLCWQLRRAPSFASRPEPYPEFVKRCFIFTEEGMTFLGDTERRPIPCRTAEDEYNNPPWVQMYVGVWQDVPVSGPTAWADYSPDRYVTRVIGTVSRDRTYLTAIATDSSWTMCQAWHDCMHNNPSWGPSDAAPADQRWRLKVYAMQNDADALLARVAKDFPNANKP